MSLGEAPAGPRMERLDVDDLARGIGGIKKKADVGTVAGHYVRPKFSGRIGYHCVHYVARASAAEQPPRGMRPLLGQAYHLTTSQQSPELSLGRRTADLNDNGSRYHRDEACLEPDPVLCPDPARVPIRRDQDRSIVDHRRHADRCSGLLRPIRRRAASSSSGVNAPCSASHSATAIRPSRSLRACLAAAVIQADTLTPSASAAATTRAWTSGSTVMASLGEGLPRGMTQTIPL
jgi:hypothetical protein